MGSQVVIPYRSGDGTELRDHKLMGDLGQIVPLPYQIRDKRSVERVIQDSNVVINCISRRRESRNFSFHDTHVNGTHMIARTAAELGVDRFIQVSVANAQEDSVSAMHNTKWHGEQIAKAFYPECTIIRPGICYGNGDLFFEYISWRWHYGYLRRPSIVYGDQKIQPVHYLDVARAVMVCLLDPLSTSGLLNIPS
jgi:NADH dehydrogenase (ubiquinone) 1 alpha subcomplex subunit 9